MLLYWPAKTAPCLFCSSAVSFPDMQATKNPHQAGFYSQSCLTAQAVCRHRCGKLLKKGGAYSAVTLPAAGPFAPLSMVKETF